MTPTAEKGQSDVLVVGSLPPPAGRRGASLLDKVLELEAAGRRPTVLALDPLSAAHRYLPAPGFAAALSLIVIARRYQEVVIQLEPGLPVRARAGRVERAAVLSALGTAMRRLPDVTLRLDHLDDLPGGYGGRAAEALWQQARSLEVGSEEVRAALAEVLGPAAGKVVVVGRGELDAPGPRDWSGAEGMTAADVVAVVRTRASAERARLAATGRLAGTWSGAATTRIPLWHWLPAPGAGVPDLGPVLGLGLPAARARGARRAFRPLLAAAERHQLTRPLASAGLSVYRRLRRSRLLA